MSKAQEAIKKAYEVINGKQPPQKAPDYTGIIICLYCDSKNSILRNKCFHCGAPL